MNGLIRVLGTWCRDAIMPLLTALRLSRRLVPVSEASHKGFSRFWAEYEAKSKPVKRETVV